MIARSNRRVKAAGAAALALLAAFSGCKLRSRGTATAPAPTVAAAAPAEPVSTPQTGERLPPPQPVPPEAIPAQPAATEVRTAEPEPAPPPKVTPPRPRPAPSTTPAGPAPPPVVTAPPPTHSPEAAPQLRPVFTPAQEKELRQRIARSLGAAEQALKQAANLPPDQERSAAAVRVRSFIDLARQARRQGDLERARSLAERAEFLAADLARVSK